MANKSTYCIIFCFLIALVDSATINKVIGIRENVTLIEIDSNSNSYVITTFSPGDLMYGLNSQNKITSTTTFQNVLNLKINQKNQLYIFDLTSGNRIKLFIHEAASNINSNPFSYSPKSLSASPFFDNDDNLFFDSADGIGIFRNNDTQPIIVSRLRGFSIISNVTHVVDDQGNVFLGLKHESEEYYTIAKITPEEKYQADPIPYFFNINNYGKLQAMATFSDGIAFQTREILMKLQNDQASVIFFVAGWEMPSNHLYSTKERLFFGMAYENPVPCYIFDDFAILTGAFLAQFNDCDFYFKTDGNGKAYIASMNPDTRLFSMTANASVLTPLNIPNTLLLYGIEPSNNGDVWILAQNLYLVPSGEVDAVKVTGLPFVGGPRPIKVKPGTGEVLIGLEDGVYIASK